MRVGSDFGAGGTSSSRALAAAGADAMRSRIEALVTALHRALDLSTSMSSPSVDALDEALGLALDTAEDVRDGLASVALSSRDPAAEVARCIDVHESLEVALRMTSSIVGRRARLVRRYDRVPAVVAGRVALTRVFSQLLQNAAEAIPPYMPLSNCITVRTYEDADGSVVVEISDTGVGISAENLPRVFDSFFTTKSGAADGLGLTIARGEVLAAGGTMCIESTEGRGACVTVRLPGVPGASGTTERICDSRLPHRRVLVVADDRATGARLHALFTDARTLVVVANADEAVERLALGEPCDVVVVDAEDDACEGLCERLVELAPDVVMRTYAVNTRAVDNEVSSESGMWSVARR